MGTKLVPVSVSCMVVRFDPNLNFTAEAIPAMLRVVRKQWMI